MNGIGALGRSVVRHDYLVDVLINDRKAQWAVFTP